MDFKANKVQLLMLDDCFLFKNNTEIEWGKTVDVD